jgi:Uncharacterised protein, DegV family COG1307
MNLTAENTAIVLDSTADFPEGPTRFPSWRIVPLYVRFGADSYRDYVDIGPDEFYARLRTAEELPTTSQPTPADFLSAYEELAGFDRVLSIQLSSKVSGTFESAGRAAAESAGRVRVIDTGTASAAIAILALAVQRRLERGTTDEEVDELVTRFKRESGLIFTLETLEYLARGGRIGRAAGWAGQLLNIKPRAGEPEGDPGIRRHLRGGDPRRAGAAGRHRPCRRAGALDSVDEARPRHPAAGRDRGGNGLGTGARHARRPRHSGALLVPGRYTRSLDNAASS